MARNSVRAVLAICFFMHQAYGNRHRSSDQNCWVCKFDTVKRLRMYAQCGQSAFVPANLIPRSRRQDPVHLYEYLTLIIFHSRDGIIVINRWQGIAYGLSLPYASSCIRHMEIDTEVVIKIVGCANLTP
eukprot:TRINITY_DN17217_c1_g1_i1.p2 TRINITY_DN17217_c1_g1~~TRINITY_DN17217_c1_g1_i1.p2  ORF type:complete len:129 (-),score=1.98 TRINITY_DN17217_c1_g1_i1:475-861(-)